GRRARADPARAWRRQNGQRNPDAHGHRHPLRADDLDPAQHHRAAYALFEIRETVMITRHYLIAALAAVVLLILLPLDAFAHNVSKRDAAFVVANQGRAIAAFLYLGAKHMVTG